MRLDPVRVRALEILLAVGQGRHLDPELANAFSGMDTRRDRAFLAELVLGTLQWRGRYDHLIDRFVRRRRPDDQMVLEVLRLGLHQLVAMDSVPPYAAIHQTAELARRKLGRGRVGFVNGFLQAVRRKLFPGSDEQAVPDDNFRKRLRDEFADLDEGSAAWIAAWQSHPRWLVDRWAGRFGIEDAAAMCDWNNRPVPIDFSILDTAQPGADDRPDRTPEQWAAALDGEGFAVGLLPRSRGLRATGKWEREQVRQFLKAYPDLIVQDATVQEATRWLLSEPGSPDPAGGDFLPAGAVLDMCSAPGGKTAHLDRSLDPGRLILALEPVKGRLRLLGENLGRIGSTRVFVVRGDGLRPPFADHSMAAVLLDGPCTGTGVIRHHPEARWRLKEGWIKERAVLLQKLAARAADLLAPGGVLLYATCSVEHEENEQVVQALLESNHRLTPMPDSQDRWHRLWLPHLAEGDGFFAARMRVEG